MAYIINTNYPFHPNYPTETDTSILYPGSMPTQARIPWNGTRVAMLILGLIFLISLVMVIINYLYRNVTGWHDRKLKARIAKDEEAGNLSEMEERGRSCEPVERKGLTHLVAAGDGYSFVGGGFEGLAAPRPAFLRSGALG